MKVERLTCVICGNKEHNGIKEKYRICTEDRATGLRKAATDLMDEAYTRIYDLKTNANIFSADLYYHKYCLNKYLYMHKAKQKGANSKDERPKKGRRVLQRLCTASQKLYRAGKRNITI